jgi:hypothetical protein
MSTVKVRASRPTAPAAAPEAAASAGGADQPKAATSEALRAELAARDGQAKAASSGTPLPEAPPAHDTDATPTPLSLGDPPLGDNARRLREEAVRKSGGATKYSGWRSERQKRLREMAREHYRRQRAAHTAEALADHAALLEVLTAPALTGGYTIDNLRRLVSAAMVAEVSFDTLMSMILKKP